MRIIQSKLKGKKPRLVGAERRRPADVSDLMARLRASLESPGRAPSREQGKGKSKGASRKRRVA